jgi:predicted Zn-dependent protease
LEVWDLRDLLELALRRAKAAGAGYCDVRRIAHETEGISARNGHVESISRSESSGFGVRVLKGGAWGFASSNNFTEEEAARVTGEAVKIAEASARSVKEKVVLSPVEAVTAEWSAAPKIDPFEMKLEDKVDLLVQAEDLMRKAAPVTLTRSSLVFYREEKTFVSSEGSLIRQRLTQSGGVITAAVSNGANRAADWNRIPLIRMTNVNLMPGDWTLDEIIKDTKHGIYMDLNRSYSIDDRRYNFQFGTEVGWEIEDGSINRMVKNPTYTGNTDQFWNSCDAISGKDEWKVWGIPNCGKGEPMQGIRVGHGVAPARFRNVRVGVGKW